MKLTHWMAVEALKPGFYLCQYLLWVEVGSAVSLGNPGQYRA